MRKDQTFYILPTIIVKCAPPLGILACWHPSVQNPTRGRLSHSPSTCRAPVPGAAPHDETGPSSHDHCLSCPHSLGWAMLDLPLGLALSPASLARLQAHSQGLVSPDARAPGALGMAAHRHPCGAGSKSPAARRPSPWILFEAAEMWRREGAAHPLPEQGCLVLDSQRWGRALCQVWSLGLPGGQKPPPGPVVSGGTRADRH